MTELHLSEVLDYIARPEAVATDANAYAVEIVGQSMAPRYEPGERAVVSPRAQVRPGDDVIVQLRAGPVDGNGRPQEEVADRVSTVLIKRLVRQTTKFVELEQFNPPEIFQIPRERIAAIHRVVGRL